MYDYVLVFVLDIKIDNRYKYMFSVRLAGDHLYGKWLFTWRSLVMSLVVSCFVLYFFPQMSLMGSGTELSQYLKNFLPTLGKAVIRVII